MDIKWNLEKMSDDSQIQGIIDLRKKAFSGEDLDKEKIDFWKWEFDDNYAGSAKIFLAVDEKKIVGHYAICPSEIIVDGVREKGSIVVDVMTDPDYRYQGMFTKLGRFSLEEAGQDGVDFSYGFPIRKTVMPGHLKVGWKIAFPLPVYVYPISTFKILKKFCKLNSASFLLSIIPTIILNMMDLKSIFCNKRYEVEVADKFDKDERLIRFIEKTSGQHTIMQPRDYKFLDWRYNVNKYRRYKIIRLYSDDDMLGYAVIRDAIIYGLDCITIMDIQVLNFDKKVINRLLYEIKKYARAKKKALIGCMINNNKYKKQLKKDMYIKSPYIFKFIIHENNKKNYMDKLYQNENWYITWGDTDDL